jgi:hypothetical protein
MLSLSGIMRSQIQEEYEQMVFNVKFESAAKRIGINSYRIAYDDVPPFGILRPRCCTSPPE